MVPVKDENDRTLIYAVNYDDGYMLISATKNYYPILAIVDHGTFTGEETNTGYDVLMNEYMVATEAAVVGKILIDGNPWARYEGVLFEKPVETKVSDEYYEVANRYTGEWYQAGYNIYYLNQKPENMPDDMYELFCDYASDFDRPDHDYMQCSFIVEEDYSNTITVGPLCSTFWGQKIPYNLSMDDTSLALGCTTIAAAQIMRALKNNYSFNSNWSLDIVNHDNADVVQSLDEGIPVYMRGGDEYSTNGHAWVCDGYRCIVDYTRYSLFVIPMEDEITELLEWERQDYYRGNTVTYHMNWGWYDNKDGYYFDHRLNMTISNEPVNYSQDRKDLIFSR